MERRETKVLEFKSKVSDSFLKTVSAYANYSTGTIIFGVLDNGTIIGLDNLSETALEIENKINSTIFPVPQFEMEPNTIDKTITLKVFEGIGKPYLYKGKAYKRSDTSSVEVDHTELKRLILEGNNQSFESLPARMKDLSFQILEEKLVQELQIGSLNLDILKTLNLYSEKTGYNMAAELLSDHNSFLGIDIVRFGQNINEFLDRETKNHVSIIELFDIGIKMFKKYYSVERISGKVRNREFTIPEKAFREALANALIHRTWDINAVILIALHNDRIEISSPGSLPIGISKEEYLAGQISLLRNPIIGNVFFRLKYIEMFGTGIRRILYDYSQSIVKPEFLIYENSIKVILPIFQENIGILSADEQVVFTALSDGVQKTRPELEEITQLNKASLVRILNSLIAKNIIQREGVGRGTSYIRK